MIAGSHLNLDEVLNDMRLGHMLRQGLPFMDILVGLLPGLVICFAQLHVEIMDRALHQRLLVDGGNVDLVNLEPEFLKLLGDLAKLEVGLLGFNELVSRSLLLGLLFLSLLLLPFDLHLQLHHPVLWIFEHLILQLIKEAKGEGSPSHGPGLCL